MSEHDKEIKSNSRVAWIDYMSGIGTLMVFMQHSCVPIITRIILGFHMPLFFWISGYLYQQNRSCRKPFAKFIVSRFRRLIVPYLIWFAIDKGQAFLMRGREYPIEFAQEVFRSFIYCSSWFLPCLFLSEIVFHFINKKIAGWGGNQWIVLSLFAILFWTCSGIENIVNPARTVFCLDTCLMALGFMFAGAVSVQIVNCVKGQREWIFAIIAIGLAGLGTVFVMLNGRNNANFMMYQNQYGNYIFAIAGALCLIFALYFAVIAFERYLPKRYLCYLRDNGILLFLVHISIISMTKEMIPALYNVSTWISSIACLCAIHMVGIPICSIVNRWFPVLAGKKKLN